MAKAKAQGKMIANNKKAYHDYFILDTYEAGIALAGTEVKSLRMGKCRSYYFAGLSSKEYIFLKKQEKIKYERNKHKQKRRIPAKTGKISIIQICTDNPDNIGIRRI